jgi:hypothetical protein
MTMHLVRHFANELRTYRPLTSREQVDFEAAMAVQRVGSREAWTPDEDHTLLILKGRGLTALAIGNRMGRTPWSVRSRIRTLKRKEMGRV